VIAWNESIVIEVGRKRSIPVPDRALLPECSHSNTITACLES
jgi:hypothetical protein